jgi:hypothetical protein
MSSLTPTIPTSGKEDLVLNASLTFAKVDGSGIINLHKCL